MASYTVESTMHCCATGRVNLGDRTWDEVESWHVKWDTLRVKFNGENAYEEFALGSDITCGIDFKYPAAVAVYPEDEHGVPDYCNLVGEVS